MPTIFDLLKDDHDAHRTLLDLIDKTEGDSEGRRELFARFKADSLAHANAEGQALYGPMLEDPDLQDEARHSVAEHKELDDLVAELEEIDFSSSGWLTKFRSLKDRYLHHIAEEEEDIFPVARKGMDDAALKKAAKTFEERKPAEKESMT